jgi:hypothetical protein
MPSQKIVRCHVSRNGSAGTIRYIPLDIFGLWCYLMQGKHGFDIQATETSLWVDLDESPEIAYSESSHEPVTEVSLFVYSDPAGMFTRISRYFPTREYGALKPIFLAHYIAPEAVGGGEPPLREKSGLFVRRQFAGV